MSTIPMQLDSDHLWKIFQSHYDQHGLARHQIESMNDFYDNGIAQVLRDEPDIVIEKPGLIYRVALSDPYLPGPTVMEEGLNLKSDRDPAVCRLRHLTYDSLLSVTVTETIIEAEDAGPESSDDESQDKDQTIVDESRAIAAGSDISDLTHKKNESSELVNPPNTRWKKPVVRTYTRVQLARIPIMLRSSRCLLSKYTPDERIDHGEDEWDHGGYFVVGGRERVILGQTRMNYNEPTVKKGKADKKLKYTADIRSMSEETGHSVSVTASIGEDDRILTFTLPYIKDQIPMGVVFRALGVETVEKLTDVIGLYDKKAGKYIKTIIRDGFRTEVDSQESAIKFIGKYCTQSGAKDSDKPAYAQQVVDGELFPHLGVATRKEKLYFLGHIVKKLLLVQLGYKSLDDRDDYARKRVETAGVLVKGLFKTLFKQYYAHIRVSLRKKRQTLDVISEMKRTNKITKGLCYAFRTGNWGVQKSAYMRVGVSQILLRFYGSALSHIRRIMVPDGKDSKSKALRQLHPSQCMNICPWECFDPATPVLMWDGSIKAAMNIAVGDYLIDDLGRPTRVRSTCSGDAIMYDITQQKDNSIDYIVTANHILTLKIREYKVIRMRSDGYEVRWFDKEELRLRYKTFKTHEQGVEFLVSFDPDDTLDIEIYKYLGMCKAAREYLFGFHVDLIKWPKQDILLDPYILGIWLGSRMNGEVAPEDPELLDAWVEWGMDYDGPDFDSILKAYDLGNVHIPEEYIVTSRDVRLHVLAGLIDAGGSAEAEGREARLVQRSVDAPIVYGAHRIAQSLGISCNVSTGTRQRSAYTELVMTGVCLGEIPIRVPQKKLNPCASSLQTAITVTEKGPGPFVGWQLEGNGRFLLGDTTVVHNTPEGAAVGVVLSMTILARVSIQVPTVEVKAVVERMQSITSVNDFVGRNDEPKVFVNGTLMGFADPDEFVPEFKRLRRQGAVNGDVSIGVSDTEYDNEIYIYSDEGRMLRPAFGVEDGFLKARKEMGTDWNDLVSRGVINYVDNSEASNGVFAFDQSELSQFKCDYYEHPAMMMGVMAGTICYAGMSPSPRLCYQASMGKQAVGCYALNHNIRSDTVVHTLDYPQRPIVNTALAEMMGFGEMGAGINAIVAIATLDGFNQEDSVVLNRSAIERGVLTANTWRCHTDETKREAPHRLSRIGLPPINKRRKDWNYSLLGEDGIVRKRIPKSSERVTYDEDGTKHTHIEMYNQQVQVQKGDVIIGKFLTVTDKGRTVEDITDCSVAVKKGEEGFIERIYESVTSTGYKIVQVTIRTPKIPEIGDKVAARSAQKGVIGMVYGQEDMPFTKDGVIPDIIINPHAIPSRMTINQLIESVMGYVGCLNGEYIDATAFEKPPDIVEEVSNALRARNFDLYDAEDTDDKEWKNHGYQRMISGQTGEIIDAKIFIGSTYYQRLKHFVSDKEHARSRGTLTTLVRQPPEGRSRDGGLRFGEMERDCTIGQGAAEFLKDCLLRRSDDYVMPICNQCGAIATTQTCCKGCNTDNVAKVNLPYAFKLLAQELSAMNIKFKFKSD